jgi:uncharacterized membrane protein
MREVASGVGILMGRRPTGWLWSRVAGDAMDLALLGAALATPDANVPRAAAATAAVAGVTVLDFFASQRMTRGGAITGPVRVNKTITINRPAQEIYRFWHDLQNLPRFMRHLESVVVMAPGRSHWRARGPAGVVVEWDAEVTEARPHELIAWRSLPGADVENRGSVRFRPVLGGRATEVTAELEYDAPGGSLGATLAKLFGEEPAQQVQEDVRRLKWILEAGEIPTTAGQPAGPALSRSLTGTERGR